MRELLYAGVGLISRIHNIIMHFNDAYEANLSDKDLHFLVIGLLGMGMILVVYPVFWYLAKKNRIMTIAWIYVFTLIVVITFAIDTGPEAEFRDTKAGRH